MSQEQENNSSNRDNFKNSICYIPFVGVWLFFTQEKRSEQLNKHIKYGTSLLIGFILLRFIIVGILMLPLGGILFLLYAGITGYFGYKAYSEGDVNIEYLDKFEETIKEKMK